MGSYCGEIIPGAPEGETPGEFWMKSGNKETKNTVKTGRSVDQRGH